MPSSRRDPAGICRSVTRVGFHLTRTPGSMRAAAIHVRQEGRSQGRGEGSRRTQGAPRVHHTTATPRAPASLSIGATQELYQQHTPGRRAVSRRNGSLPAGSSWSTCGSPMLCRRDVVLRVEFATVGASGVRWDSSREEHETPWKAPALPSPTVTSTVRNRFGGKWRSMVISFPVEAVHCWFLAPLLLVLLSR